MDSEEQDGADQSHGEMTVSVYASGSLEKDVRCLRQWTRAGGECVNPGSASACFPKERLPEGSVYFLLPPAQLLAGIFPATTPVACAALKLSPPWLLHAVIIWDLNQSRFVLEIM